MRVALMAGDTLWPWRLDAKRARIWSSRTWPVTVRSAAQVPTRRPHGLPEAV